MKKPLEKKQSSRISFVSRSVDQEVVRRSSEGAAGAKKLPAQSCKKFIPAIAVMNGSASCRQTFDQTVQTDSSSIQAATRVSFISLSLSLSTVCWDKGSPAASRLTSCRSDSFVFFLSVSAAFCLISSFDIFCTADGHTHKESSGFEAQAKGTCE